MLLRGKAADPSLNNSLAISHLHAIVAAGLWAWNDLIPALSLPQPLSSLFKRLLLLLKCLLFHAAFPDFLGIAKPDPFGVLAVPQAHSYLTDK